MGVNAERVRDKRLAFLVGRALSHFFLGLLHIDARFGKIIIDPALVLPKPGVFFLGATGIDRVLSRFCQPGEDLSFLLRRKVRQQLLINAKSERQNTVRHAVLYAIYLVRRKARRESFKIGLVKCG